MRKFSNKSNDNIIDTKDIMKEEISKLVDSLLNVSINECNGDIKIDGKDILIESIYSLIDKYKVNNDVKLLESLKSRINDWAVIDSIIEEITLNNKDLINEKRYLINMYNNYSDKDIIYNLISESCMKIDNIETIRPKYEASLQLYRSGRYDSSFFLKISNIYKRYLSNI